MLLGASGPPQHNQRETVMRKLILAGLAVLLLAPVVGSQTRHLNAPTPESDLGNQRPWRDLNVSRNIVAGGAATIRGNATVAGTLGVTGTLTATVTDWNTTSTKGAIFQPFVTEEEITLATGGVTTDSTANLLPADSIILGVATRITDTITTAVNFQVGISGATDRFDGADTNVTAADTAVKLDHIDAGAMVQAAAAKVRITTNANPGAGKIRVTVFGYTFSAATS